MPALDQAPEVPTLFLDPNEHAPRRARDFIAKCFCDLGIADDYVGRVVVSELVANVCVHVKIGQIIVRVVEDERDRSVAIEVWDQGEKMPVIVEADECAESGRGLFMMSLLVREWGVRPITEGGKIIWARLDR
ncbi:hypothetical protein GCM10022254_74050 [Actinomadura meridiana]|uniref:Histidine kinase/HSP90-like ATPase domain-containing protein n=1 Tax=Actinomadura meridiana TaxID=559626 RepID=A0ABP8CQI3_9ACTN